MMLILFVLLMTIVLLELFNRIKKHGIVKPILSLALGVSFLIFYQISFPLTNIEIFCNILLIISLMALFFYSIYSFAIFALKTKEDSTHLDNVFKTISVYLIVIIAMTIVMCLVSVYFRYSRQTLDSLINPDEKRETYQIFYSYIFGNKPSIACLANMSLAVVWSVLLVMRLRKSKCAETSNLNN